MLRNPNRPDPLSGAHIELSGTVGGEGRASCSTARSTPRSPCTAATPPSSSVEDDTVYVTMGGGCQGCAVSAMTLREGIARSIKEAIPEVAEVIDTTDHAMGENPYYT